MYKKWIRLLSEQIAYQGSNFALKTELIIINGVINNMSKFVGGRQIPQSHPWSLW